ncbi:MAG: glycosyl hydrolase, partial [Verrucomicrobiae bacterium]|nr:glycosyl hydrolase [Verrucomicrobiae bacterium]
NGQLSWSVPADTWRIMLFVCVPDGAGNLVDYLDPEAVKKFISLTYEQYYSAFPEHFGKTIDSAFYDEPTFHWVQGGRAWTPGFNREFERRHGYNPALLYPALWYDIGPDTAAARNLLFGLRAELFSRGFIKTVADWCQNHGIELTGHVDQEEIINPVGLCGDLIKTFEHQPIPGLDQIFAYDRGSRMYKLISSAAVNYGRRRVMSECYGAMQLPVANLYREAMDQFAKGVNLMVPHAVWYSTNSIVFPPELSWRTEPYASALPAYNEYIGRLQCILQHGRPVVDIAVLYPIAGLQAAYHFGVGDPYHGGVIPEWADYMTVGELLSLDLRQDFTYLHPETLDGRCRVVDNTLRLEHPEMCQVYRVLILPGTTTISAANMAKIQQFFDAGGCVIATTRLPDQSAEIGLTETVRRGIRHLFGEETARMPHEPPRNLQTTASSTERSNVFAPNNPSVRSGSAGRLTVNRNNRGGAAWFIEHPDVANLGRVLSEALPTPDVAWPHQPRVQGGHLTYLHKHIAGREFYFFANSSDTPVTTPIRLRGRMSLERWDPHRGCILPQPVELNGNVTIVQLELSPLSSVFLVGKENEADAKYNRR